jgi:hypothetical protein
MKNFTQVLGLFLLIASVSFAQQEKGIFGPENWLTNWTEFKPNQVNYLKPTQILSGTITKDTKLYKRDTYLLLGSVFVADSTTLTIEPGTVIIGDYDTNGALIISKSAKIIADGLATDPIVFTSNRSVKKEGDWGGIFILGDAPINKFGNVSSINYGLRPSSAEYLNYGGDNCSSNSGILRYVRIEYGGKRTRDYGYYSGLTLAGIGAETVIENVMVSYSEGNSFNIIGGELKLDKMISYRTKSNDFEFNYGTQCHITNSLAVRSPYVSGASGSRCMYVASYDKKEDIDFNKKGTFVNAQNLTLINVTENLEDDINVGLVKEAVYVANDASVNISKTVISGFKPAVILDDKIKVNAENLEKIRLTEMYFNNCKGNIFTAYNSNNEDLENWYGNRAFFNVYSKGVDSETFIDSHNSRYPDFRLRINKIIASNDYDDE